MKSATLPFALIIAVLGTLIGALAISNDSVWIDEAHTAEKAAQPTLSAWWHVMEKEDGSDAQMPFYMLYMWGWGQVFGLHPEWLLRSSNLPWFFIAQLALCLALRPWPRWMIASALVLAIHPFAWYYLDEARPYVMQFAAMMLVTGFFVWRLKAPGPSLGWSMVFGLGLLLLCGSSMLGALWAASALLLLWLWRKDLKLTRQDWSIVGTAVLLLAGLGCYYISTFLHNAKPTHGETGLLNLAFAFYELLGFAGLGPGRDEIRVGGIAAFKPHWIFLSVAILLWSGVLFAGAKLFFKSCPRRHWTVLLLSFAPIAVVFVLSAASHSRLLGRHLTPTLPALILLTGAGLSCLVRSRATISTDGWRTVAGAAVVSAAMLLFACSGYLLRTAPRHRNDDYRSAAALVDAVVKDGKIVWWAADKMCGEYYGIPLRDAPVPAYAWYLRNPATAALASVPAPSLLVMTRPDVYDDTGAISAYTRERKLQPIASPRAFVLWSR